MSTAIKIQNLSKQYRLGQVGTGTVSHDLNRWWAKIRGKEDPFATVGQVNQRDQAADGDYVWALKDVNLDVEQGEVLGIIGANGAGKSTLLKLISRITSPTEGTIKAKGRIASLLEVGTGMHPEMTARENIYLNGSILGMRRYEISRKFDDIIDFAGCRMFVDTPVKRFSSGMRVRLGFAVAAFLEPEILIVDEVLAVGDAEFQKHAIGKMKEISQGGRRTVLFVSHNMYTVGQLCTQTALCVEGTIKRIGETKDVVREYLTSQAGGDVGVAELSEAGRARSGLGDVVKISRCRLLDGNASTSEYLNFGDDLIVEIELTATEDVPRAFATIGIDSEDNTRIATSTMADADQSFDLVPQQRQVITARFRDLRLNVGTYGLTFVVRTNAKVLDRIDGAMSFDVIASSNGDEKARRKVVGFVRVSSEWTVNEGAVKWNS